ncbi:YqgE/AlgH family protein [Alkalimarinus coralli]|uniref:YqgE/AlgH family protein n=1 Tax=Alkalimarinus coralli TaxID=2935863 RepID=UPI00202AFA8E|nr:YqgE/AlgH family protein [Alkalimarinus coralli]
MTSLRDHFLIAMPRMKDPNFEGTVTYICDHNEHGAMGIVINRPLDMKLGEILAQLDLGGEDISRPIYGGGPVQMERGFVLHSPEGEWQSSLKISDGICLTTSRDILEALAVEQGPTENLVALGYAGWGAGQLEQEIAENCWLTCPSDEGILFRAPAHKKFDTAISLLGFDPSQLSDQAGHA